MAGDGPAGRGNENQMTSTVHAPVVIPSPGGVDTIPAVHACVCGAKPTKGAASMSTMSTWIQGSRA